jgi:hypothetical protein
MDGLPSDISRKRSTHKAGAQAEVRGTGFGFSYLVYTVSLLGNWEVVLRGSAPTKFPTRVFHVLVPEWVTEKREPYPNIAT